MATEEGHKCSIQEYLCEDEVYEALRTDSGKVETEKGVEIYYEVYGNGSEKILLVMGLGGTAAIWLPNVKYLLEHDENIQICILDNRGIGRSSVPPGRYKTSIMAQDAIKVVDHIGWEKFHVVGISMGGMISQEIALAALDRVKTLYLAVTHCGKTGSLPPWAGIKGSIAANKAKTAEAKAPITMAMLYPEEFMNLPMESGKTFGELAIERYIAGAKKLPPNPLGFRSQVLAVQTHSVGKARLELLRKSKIPILICTGDNDHLVNPQASFYLKSLLNPVEFIHWKKTGHGVLYQQFDEFNDAILRHYKRGTSSEE